MILQKKRPHKVNLTCYAGHFLLTDLLLEKIKVTAKESSIEGRVVIVASDSYKHPYREGFRFDKINDESEYCFLTQITDSFILFACSLLSTRFMIHTDLNLFQPSVHQENE